MAGGAATASVPGTTLGGTKTRRTVKGGRRKSTGGGNSNGSPAKARLSPCMRELEYDQKPPVMIKTQGGDRRGSPADWGRGVPDEPLLDNSFRNGPDRPPARGEECNS